MKMRERPKGTQKGRKTNSRILISTMIFNRLYYVAGSELLAAILIRTGIFMKNMQCGPQPLDEIMTRLGFSNADIVRFSTEQLTHKMVQKGRKGRRITLNIQQKILKAINAAQNEQVFTLKELFNY
jgi:hypothetical protein